MCFSVEPKNHDFFSMYKRKCYVSKYNKRFVFNAHEAASLPCAKGPATGSGLGLRASSFRVEVLPFRAAAKRSCPNGSAAPN